AWRGLPWQGHRNHSVEKDHYPTDCWNVLFINAWVDTVASDDILAGARRGRDVRLDNLGAHHNSDTKEKLVAIWRTKEAMAVLYEQELERIPIFGQEPAGVEERLSDKLDHGHQYSPCGSGPMRDLEKAVVVVNLDIVGQAVDAGRVL
ncbi:unnamed protein product, partial [marine sediment metagenome]